METLINNLTPGQTAGGIALLAALICSVFEISKLEINPWSALFGWIGKTINGPVLKELAEVRATQQETREKLDAHIRVDDERNADAHRQRILEFNTELLRDMRHTREEFIEILAEIDYYEHYCAEHPEYKNNRAVHAIANIGRVYDERLKKHDFL